MKNTNNKNNNKTINEAKHIYRVITIKKLFILKQRECKQQNVRQPHG